MTWPAAVAAIIFATDSCIIFSSLCSFVSGVHTFIPIVSNSSNTIESLQSVDTVLQSTIYFLQVSTDRRNDRAVHSQCNASTCGEENGKREKESKKMQKRKRSRKRKREDGKGNEKRTDKDWRKERKRDARLRHEKSRLTRHLRDETHTSNWFTRSGALVSKGRLLRLL